MQDSRKQVILNAANDWIAIKAGTGSHGVIRSVVGEAELEKAVIAAAGRSFDNMGGGDNQSGDTTPLLNHGDRKVLTTTSGKLTAKGTQYVIHALGPDFRTDFRTKQGDGLKVLREVYQDVFKEMVKLHAKDEKIVSIGMLPVSGSIFRGSVPVNDIYTPMVEETIQAMKSNAWLKPTFCMFQDVEFNDMHKYLMSFALEQAKLIETSPTANAISLSIGSIGKMHPSEKSSLVEGEFRGLAVQGYVAAAGNRQLGSVMLGKQFGHNIVGVEFESALDQHQVTYSAIKAKAEIQMAQLGALIVAAGVARESLENTMSQNIKSFLQQLNVNTNEVRRVSYLMAIAHTYSWVSEKTKLSTLFGVRSVYHIRSEHVPFIGVNTVFDSINMGIFASTREFSLNFELKE